jgi:hypothetical protein
LQWTINETMNSSKSGIRSVELSPQELDCRDTFGGRPRQPIPQGWPGSLIFRERCQA